jgi:hypothetical protein
MRYRLPFSVLALATASFTVTGAQTPTQPRQQRIGNLELRLQPERVERGVPRAFSFLLVNKTDHDVRVPIPTVDCEDSFDGDIELRLRFTPLKPGPLDEGRGCAHDREDWPPVMNRIKEWKIVHAGDALVLQADREHLFYDDSKPGTYEFWAVYSPPSIDPADQQKLQRSGIDFPQEKLRTRRLSFLRAE